MSAANFSAARPCTSTMNAAFASYVLSPLAGLVAPERPHPLREFAQIREGAPARQRIARDVDVDVEHVLPGAPAKRPRFQLGQIDVAECKTRERSEERAGLALEREDDRRLVGLRHVAAAARDDEKARDVPLEVLDRFPEHLQVEHFRRALRRDRRRVVAPALAHHLRGSRGIVDRHDVYARQALQEILTLRERLRMGVDDLHRLHWRARQREQAMVYAQLHFADDRQFVLDEQIVVAMNAAADGVLHRQDPGRLTAPRSPGEDVLETAARQHVRFGREAKRGRFAVSARLTLECNSHGRYYTGRHLTLTLGELPGVTVFVRAAVIWESVPSR